MTRRPNTLIIYTDHLLHRFTRTAVFWTLGFSIYTILIVLSFPAFIESSPFDPTSMPPALVEAFNLADLNRIEIYLASQVHDVGPLVLSFLPITIFAGAIVGAEERGALDIILGNPMPRRHLVLGTWITVAVIMVVLLTVLGASSWLTAVMMDIDLGATESFLAAYNMFPVCMAFGGLALWLSASVRQRGVVIGVPVGLMFLMYLINIIGKIIPEIEALRYVSAFSYYGEALVSGMPWGGAAVLLAVSIVFLIVSIPAFDRRDIYT